MSATSWVNNLLKFGGVCGGDTWLHPHSYPNSPTEWVVKYRAVLLHWGQFCTPGDNVCRPFGLSRPRGCCQHLPGHRTAPPLAYHCVVPDKLQTASWQTWTLSQSITTETIRIIPGSKVAGGGNFLPQGAHGSESKYTVDAGDKDKQNPV